MSTHNIRNKKNYSRIITKYSFVHQSTDFEVFLELKPYGPLETIEKRQCQKNVFFGDVFPQQRLRLGS